MHHGLFAIHVFPGIQCVYGYLLVPVVGSADDHRIDVFSVENFLVVGGEEQIVPPPFFGGRQPALVQVAGRHQFRALVQEAGLGVFRTHTAGADQSYIKRFGRS